MALHIKLFITRSQGKTDNLIPPNHVSDSNISASNDYTKTTVKEFQGCFAFLMKSKIDDRWNIRGEAEKYYNYCYDWHGIFYLKSKNRPKQKC